MKFMRISNAQIINIDGVNRIEIIENVDLLYGTIHFTDGSSYRCTEDETQSLLKLVEPLIEKSAV